jgi:hypothetical protein
MAVMASLWFPSIEIIDKYRGPEKLFYLYQHATHAHSAIHKNLAAG